MPKAIRVSLIVSCHRVHSGPLILLAWSMLLERTISVGLVRALVGFHGGLQHWVRCVPGTGCPGSTAGRANAGEICFTGLARSGDRPTALLASFRGRKKKERKKIHAQVTDRARPPHTPPRSQPSLQAARHTFNVSL